MGEGGGGEGDLGCSECNAMVEEGNSKGMEGTSYLITRKGMERGSGYGFWFGFWCWIVGALSVRGRVGLEGVYESGRSNGGHGIEVPGLVPEIVRGRCGCGCGCGGDGERDGGGT